MTSIKDNPYVLPFLWMKGESQLVIAEELKKIYESGIREICIESRPHPHFLEESWWDDMDFIMAEAKKKEMRIWLLDDAHFPTGYANGLIEKKYPERKKIYLAHNIIDVVGKLQPVEIPLKELIRPLKSWRDFNKEEPKELKNNKLLSITAFPLSRENTVFEVGAVSVPVDTVSDYLKVHLPQGLWRLIIVYQTTFGGGNPAYINIIDKESVSTLIEAVYEPHYQRYQDEFGKTFAGFFSDEPGFGNTIGFDKDERIGRKNMPLPWSKDMADELYQIYGESWKNNLPFLWIPTDESQKSLSMRLNYMNVITKLYEKNFSEYLGSWCKEHRVEYIGHVIEDNNQDTRLGSGAGHFFRAMKGQSMAGIDTIGCQIIPGSGNFTHSNKSQADGEFFHYALAKLADSSARLDKNKKGRALCELFGAYGWKLGVRDMFWITNHLLARGINHFVPHAFSMAEYPDVDCPPHFFARGNNPQFPYFGELIKYMKNLGDIFRDSQLHADTAILYHAESDWLGNAMAVQKPAKELTQNQIDFLIVSNDMLNEARLKANHFEINHHKFTRLIIPCCEFITEITYQFIRSFPKIEIIFIDQVPQGVVGLKKVTPFKQFNNCKILSLTKLSEHIGTASKSPLFISDSQELVSRAFSKGNQEHLFLFNESLLGSVSLKLVNKSFQQFNVYNFEWEEKILTTNQISLAPYEAILLRQVSQEEDEKLEATREFRLDVSKNWSFQTARAIDYPNFSEVQLMNNLVPISINQPEFSGIIRYEKKIDLLENYELNAISLEWVFETCRIWIDDQLIGIKCTPPYILAKDLFLAKGEHTIVIEVATTLDREQRFLKTPSLLPIFEPSEPTGMFGEVFLLVNRLNDLS